MTKRERQICVLDLLAHHSQRVRDSLLPEELADLRSLLEDLKGEQVDKTDDADKLRTLAKWFDVHDSGIPQNSGDEVQRDLLRIADYLAPTSIPSK